LPSTSSGLPAAPAAAADAPDVYVLLLDAYPGREASRQEPSFDAGRVPDALRARGFDVADGRGRTTSRRG
jgi:hypothetical protein